ncbi:MAG: hypothetical protein NTW86_29115 [Candidatus Sumerlaeota bacterium]|nr:hypothetical protein [Candidatus Sumerlaeota bacterium]
MPPIEDPGGKETGRILEDEEVDWDRLRFQARLRMEEYGDWQDEEGDDEDEDEDDRPSIVDEMDEEDLLAYAGDNMPPVRREVEQENAIMLRRHQQFRTAAVYVAKALAELPAVRRVTLFGSAAQPLRKEVPRFRRFRRAKVRIWHECRDLDLAVWVSELGDLRAVQKARAQTLLLLQCEKDIGTANHQVDVHILEPGTDRYLGRLCEFKDCPRPAWKCEGLDCGNPPYLRRFRDFRWRPDALRPEASTPLFIRESK